MRHVLRQLAVQKIGRIWAPHMNDAQVGKQGGAFNGCGRGVQHVSIMMTNYLFAR